MTAFRISAIAFALLFTQPVSAEEVASGHLHTVEKYIAAFNAHDTCVMAGLVTDDVDWINIAGDKVVIETRGKSELVASMNAYFKSCPTCQSALSGSISTPERVSTIEVASWQEKGTPRSQRSVSVYEFSEGLIRRVYYFPAEI